MKKGRDFLDLNLIDSATLRELLAFGHRLKKAPLAHRLLQDRVLALVFEKPSTRTRISFEVGIRQLGGQAINLSGAELQLGHGESIGDTGRVMSRYVDLIMIRTFEESKVRALAAGASIPVINGLTNQTHPCQVLADLMTVEERLGSIDNKVVTWIGDGGANVLASWIHAAALVPFELRIVCPPEFPPAREVLVEAQKKGARVHVGADIAALEGSDVVLTDCWASMHNSDIAARHERLAPYQVNGMVMRRAKPSAIFMHCLPAHRGEEVTDEVMDSAQSAIWDEAENRLHIQKAVMCWCKEIEG